MYNLLEYSANYVVAWWRFCNHYIDETDGDNLNGNVSEGKSLEQYKTNRKNRSKTSRTSTTTTIATKFRWNLTITVTTTTTTTSTAFYQISHYFNQRT